MITGSCHCGTVKFEVAGEITQFEHCHCHTCRKIHGTVYGSSAITPADGFTVVDGEEGLTAYRSSPGKQRFFCRYCGSHVFARTDAQPDRLLLRVGTLNTDPLARAEAHIWVEDKAPWYDICDDLPRYPAESS